MKPFLHGKKTLDAPPLRLPPGLTASLAPSSGSAVRPPAVGHAHSPTVETVKEGDKVVRLVITCGCGERVEVECLYPAGH
ncbi:MAG: hypothetical protein H7343_03465 [Undibacterium sp.]|nr:hypothetical protein [Opitutaceae bacterium]